MRRGRAGRHAAASHRRRNRQRCVQQRGIRASGAAGMGRHTPRNAMIPIIFFAIFGFTAFIVGIALMAAISIGSGVGLTCVGGAFMMMALCTYLTVRNRPMNRTVAATAISATTASGTVPSAPPDFSITQSAFAAAPTPQTIQSGYGGFSPYPDSTQTNNYSYPTNYYPPPPPAGSYPSGAPPSYDEVVK